LAISHEPKILIDAIGEHYKVKPGSDKEPDIYLGVNVKKVQMLDGREVWATSLVITSRMLSKQLKVYSQRKKKGTY
jgi:hypothetical protein